MARFQILRRTARLFRVCTGIVSGVPGLASAKKGPSTEVAEWYQEQFDNDLKLACAMHAAGVPMLAGSDSLDVFNYPGSSLPQELKLLVDAGLTPVESQQTATSNQARFFGRDQPGGFGRIAPGYLADW